MTPEEAINELRDASDNEVRYGDTEHHYNEVMKRIEALDMAIKALEQESITWIVGKDNAQVAVRNMPIDKMQKICAIIGDDEKLTVENCLDDARENFMSDVYNTLDFLPTNKEANLIIDSFDRVTSDIKQQPKTGHWIEKEDYNLDTYYDCSECGESFCLIDGTPKDNLYNYCPNCGARMGESEEEDER